MRPSFSELWTSVKPRHRTDRFNVLAALYHLRADEAVVTAADVSALLKLHLGAKAPKNVSACLRSYASDVEVVDAGPPLRWRLTTKGVTALRTASGLELKATATSGDFGADVGVVCALEHPEFTAVMHAAGGPSKWKEIGDASIPHRYRETTVLTAAGRTLRVVGTTSMSMGLTSAAIVTTQMVLMHRPRIVVMVGIAAGTKGGGKQFGDVLVADPSVDYNSGKVVDADGIREFLPDPYPIGVDPRLRSLLQKYSNAPDFFTAIRGRWKHAVPPKANRLHVGPLGAADQVIDDESRVLEIQRNWRKLVGVEMETYAVYRACHDAPDPKPRFVSFKAVCDFAAAKSDSWQAFAAFSAAEFAFDFLKAEWDSLWPDLKNERSE